jgi:hypothetical protein
MLLKLNVPHLHPGRNTALALGGRHRTLTLIKRRRPALCHPQLGTAFVPRRWLRSYERKQEGVVGRGYLTTYRCYFIATTRRFPESRIWWSFLAKHPAHVARVHPRHHSCSLDHRQKIESSALRASPRTFLPRREPLASSKLMPRPRDVGADSCGVDLAARECPRQTTPDCRR